jgi:hypothetical protein
MRSCGSSTREIIAAARLFLGPPQWPDAAYFADQEKYRAGEVTTTNERCGPHDSLKLWPATVTLATAVDRPNSCVIETH